jgi:signal transduction histidine kinase
MKMETPQAVASSAEALWLQGELVRNLMHTQRTTQWVALALVPVIALILWTDKPPIELLVWTGLGLLVSVARIAVIWHYETQVEATGPDEHLAFFRRTRLIWPVSALVWGLTTLLYFDRSPLADQYICWLLLACLTMFSTNVLSSQLATLRLYLNILIGTAVAVMLWRMVVERELAVPPQHWWLLGLIALFWHLLRRMGQRLHHTHSTNLQLQYRNAQLIDSLTSQTQAALDAVEIKNRFLASAAHDIRQPVHALGFYADWLRSEPELVHDLAPKIFESTKAVNQLFDSLFDLARLDSGKVRLRVDAVDVAKLLKDLELQYRPMCEAKGLRFRLRMRAGTAISDPILLQRIVGNLISNAVRYTLRGGVLVAVRKAREGLRIEIWDTGSGIAPEHQREIFREFYKVPGHVGTEEGFGLGLYIVLRLTHILGHPLTFRSVPGRGSVFRLLLQPTDAHAAAERSLNTGAPTALAEDADTFSS